MNVLVDALLYQSQAAGIGRYIDKLFSAYTELFPDDQVTALVPPGQNLLGAINVVPVEDLKSSRQRLLYEQWRLRPWAKTQAYDVIHFGDYQMPIIGSLPRAIVTVHDLVAFRYPELFPRGSGATKRFLMRRSVAHASRVIVPSLATSHDLQGILGVPEGKISVVPHGVTPLEGDAGPSLHQRPYFLAVGTIEPRKNFERLIEAFAKVFANVPDGPDLLIAGKPGWLYRSAMEAPSRLGVAERVRFLGYVADQSLKALYRDCVAVTYPSLYEGFGFPVAEALWLGKPVLCSRGGALEEVAGDDALIVDPLSVSQMASGLEELWKNLAFWQARALAGSARVQQLTWTRAAQATRDVYVRTVGDSCQA
ncbi:MAG: glycosyltransferase family 1 protein [Sulfobacillus benefaciens]|uniref:Glycosyltransferase family 1 protein n=1 Tax=Sulfobacillus benefaciens TaxID=453960 RepID=A0A2T2XIS5_9FIRM|nr:MAG: glycosyltransferase family 1 protein [Sulfobacillus benefaciens]